MEGGGEGGRGGSKEGKRKEQGEEDNIRGGKKRGGRGVGVRQLKSQQLIPWFTYQPELGGER